jgi:hypothetical protein
MATESTRGGGVKWPGPTSTTCSMLAVRNCALALKRVYVFEPGGATSFS